MWLQQFGLAILFYFLVVGIFRLAGKRFAGQTTTFDLIILISLGVALQNLTLLEGRVESVVFVVTVFLLHTSVGKLMQKYSKLRHLLRGKPRNLIQDGEVLHEALRTENLSLEDLKAGLRKMGIEDYREVHTAFLEETGQISAIRKS